MSIASKIAEEIITKVGGNVKQAAEAMESRVLKDDALFKELMLPMVSRACYDFICDVVHSRRRSICDTVKRANDEMAGSIALQNTARSMLDFPLPGGLLLRDATRHDCVDAAVYYERQASDMFGKGRFLRSVAKRAGNKSVGDSITEIELCRLFKSAMQS